MYQDMVKAVIWNTTLMLAANYIFSSILHYWQNRRASDKVILGLIMGVVSAICMFLPVQLATGVIFDMRVIVVGCAGLIGGPVTGIISTIFPVLYRLHLGGVGTGADIVAIMGGVSVGVTIHMLLDSRGKSIKLRHYFLCGILIAVLGAVTTLLLPESIERWAIIKKLMLTVAIIYPLAAVGFGYLFNREIRNVQNRLALHKSQQRYQSLFEISPVPLWEEDFTQSIIYLKKAFAGNHDVNAFFDENPDVVRKCGELMVINDVNQAAISLHNAESKDDLLKSLTCTFTESSYHTFRSGLQALLEGAHSFEAQAEVKTLDGIIKRIIVSWYVPPENRNEYDRVLVSTIDISNEEVLRAQLEQMSRLKAVGQLAGGIAHDFNNILSGIMNYSELARVRVENDSKVTGYLDKIIAASKRAAGLVDQILTFSRQHESSKEPCHLKSILDEVYSLIAAAIPSTIRIDLSYLEDDVLVKVDPNKVHEVIMNIATNAVQSMNEKGVLSLNLYTEILEKTKTGALGDIKPGTYAIVEVRDTGQGIPEENIKHIFEPFYTTKSPNEGTGLGLSVVYGIMEEHEGNIEVESRVDHGTVFRLYFSEAQHASEESEETSEDIKLGEGGILFVDDDPLVLEAGSCTIKSLGYQVCCIDQGQKALSLLTKDPDKFQLVITDQTMPEMTGLELAESVNKINEKLPVILCSGDTSKLTPAQLKKSNVALLLGKPISRQQYAEAIQRFL